MPGVRLLCCVMTVDLVVHHSQLGLTGLIQACTSFSPNVLSCEAFDKELHKQEQTDELQHLHNVGTRFHCSQAFLSTDLCRDDICRRFGIEQSSKIDISKLKRA